MKLFEVLSHSNDALASWFKQEYVHLDSLFDNTEISDQMDNYLSDFLDKITQTRGVDLFFPKDMVDPLNQAITNNSSVQVADMLRNYLTTFEDWKDSNEGKDAMHDLADKAEYDADPYKYYGVNRSDF